MASRLQRSEGSSAKSPALKSTNGRFGLQILGLARHTPISAPSKLPAVSFDLSLVRFKTLSLAITQSVWPPVPGRVHEVENDRI